MNCSSSKFYWLKWIDIALQIACIVIPLLLAFVHSHYWTYVFLEAPLQILSCLLWLPVRHTAITNARRQVSLLYLIILLIGIVFYFTGYGFWLYLYAMLLVGPICGSIYFIVSCRELSRCSKMMQFSWPSKAFKHG